MSLPIIDKGRSIHWDTILIDHYESPGAYWREVKSTLLDILVTFVRVYKPEFIIVAGDRANDDFMAYLTGAIQDHLGHVPPIYVDDALLVTAKGGAEPRRRTAYIE